MCVREKPMSCDTQQHGMKSKHSAALCKHFFDIILDIFCGGLDFLCLFLVMESHLRPSDQSHTFPHQHVYCLSASPLKSHRQCSNNLQIIPALVGYHIISTSRIARRLGAGAHISANRIILTLSHCANGCIITMFLERTPNVVVLKWLCTHIYLHEIQISCIFSSYGDDQMSGCEKENKIHG